MLSPNPSKFFSVLFKAINVLVWLFISFVFIVVYFGHPSKKLININNWPERDFSQWVPLPPTETFVERTDETKYFHQWVGILNTGVINRMNIQDGLDQQHRYEDFRTLYQFYQTKQNEVLDQLSILSVPEKLHKFHSLVIEAGIEQIQFYQDYTSQRAKQKTFQLKNAMNNAHLIASDQKLHQAYDLFKTLYPSINKASNNAIEQRLAWFDII